MIDLKPFSAQNSLSVLFGGVGDLVLVDGYFIAESFVDDMIDEVIYAMQHASEHVYVVTPESPKRLLGWASSSRSRQELMARLDHVFWGIRIRSQVEADRAMASALEWPCKNRVAQITSEEVINLGHWIQHDFSMDPARGTCEDCSRGRSDWRHTSDRSCPLSWIVLDGCSQLTASFLANQAARAGVPITSEVEDLRIQQPARIA